jgi:hypothetical protein
VTFAKIQTVFELGYHYKQRHFKHGFYPHNPLHLLTVIKLTLHFHSQTRHKSNMHNTQKKSREKEARPLLPPEFLYLLRLHIAQISSESRLCNIPLDRGNTATAKDSISYQTKGKCRTQITKLGCIIATNRMIS